MIICFSGAQRSGKTLFSVLLARKLQELEKREVYTNMVNVPGFITIHNILDIPNTPTPKILLLDEAPNLIDSRDYKLFANNGLTIWFNTLRKRNIHLFLTAINPNMIELRIRSQIDYLVLCKPVFNCIQARVLDANLGFYKDLFVPKTTELFNYCNYNTLSIPNIIEMDVKDWIKKINS